MEYFFAFFIFPDFFTEGESGSDEGSEVSSEEAGLHWVARLRLLPMYCIEGEEGGKDPCYHDIDHFLQELEVLNLVTHVTIK